MRPAPLLLGLAVLALLGVGAFYLLGGEDEAGEAQAATAALPAATEEAGPGAAPLAGAGAPDSPASRPDPTASRVALPDASAAAPDEPEEAEPEGPFLHGRVTDVDGYPVAGAEVRVKPVGERSTGFFIGARLGVVQGDEDARTADDGSFQVPRGDFEDEVEVEVRARGYSLVSEPRGIDTKEGDAWLGPMLLDRAVVLGGVVLDAEGQPVAGATVRRIDAEKDGWMAEMEEVQARFGGDSLNAVETDDEGRFELPHEMEGPYVLLVRHDHHPDGRFDGATPPPGGENTSLVLQLEPAGTIAGRVVGFPNGREYVVVAARPVRDEVEEEDAGALALFFQNAGLSGRNVADVEADGTFEVRGLDPAETYRVQTFVREGFLGRTPASDEKRAPGETPELELAWDPGATLSLRVRDEATEGLLSDVTVRFRWEDRGPGDMGATTKTRSFDDGNVEIEELRPQPSPSTLELIVSSPGYLDQRIENVSVVDGMEVELGVVRLVKAATVRVTVAEAATGEPIERARVWLHPEGEEQGERGIFSLSERSSSGKTGDGGVIELPACPTPTATLEVWRAGYARHQLEGVTMPISGVAEHRVVLSEGGRVEVVVTDTLGRPAEDVNVRHERPDGNRDSLSTNSKGVARARNLVPGDHRFRADTATGGRRGGGIRVEVDGEVVEDPWKTVRIADGVEATVRLTIPATATLSGTVRSRGGPVPHVSVALLPGESQTAADEMRAELEARFARFGNRDAGRSRTDARGRFELAEVPTGKHRLRISGGDLPIAHFVPVEIRNGSNKVDVELPSASIEGRVVDARGVPVPDARVRVVRADAESGDGDELQELAFASSIFGGGGPRGTEVRADGTFTLDGVPSGVPVAVVASARGYVDGRSEPREIAEDQVVRGVDVVLSSGGSIRVEAPEASGIFVFATATYEGEADPPPTPRVQMVRDGAAVLRDLEPGPWRVELDGFDDDEEDDGQRVEVRAGEESLVRL